MKFYFFILIDYLNIFFKNSIKRLVLDKYFSVRIVALFTSEIETGNPIF